jgi:hypothetical protein
MRLGETTVSAATAIAPRSHAACQHGGRINRLRIAGEAETLMSGNKNPPGGDLKLVSATNPPPVQVGEISQAAWKRFRMLEQLADSIVELESHLLSKCYASSLEEDEPNPDDARLAFDEERDIARARELTAEFDSDELYEQDDEGDRVLKDAIVVDRLTLLMNAVSVGKTRTADEAFGFATLLVAHVTDCEPSFLVLESACRALEGREKFSQTIAEVTGEIVKQQKLWAARRRALGNIEITAKRALAESERALMAWRLRLAGDDVRDAKVLVDNRRRNQTACADRIVREQEAARDAYKRGECAIRAWHAAQRELEEAAVILASAEVALAALQPIQKRMVAASDA